MVQSTVTKQKKLVEKYKKHWMKFKWRKVALNRKKDKVWNFEDLMSTTKINDKDVHIDPTILLSRLTALANFK